MTDTHDRLAAELTRHQAPRDPEPAPPPSPPAEPAPLTPEQDYARTVAARDEARAERRDLLRADAVTRLATAAGADPDRLADSRAFTDAYAELGHDPADADVTAAIQATVAAQPSLRAAATGPVRRPPGASAGQGSSSTSTATDAQRRATAAANPTPAGRIAHEIRRAADAKRNRS